ncbi:hypothetical protein AB0N38_10740 [Micromonospora aurantiaca]|uniref:hypothetical protein n=1 Tax=Micromonospora aurantiaca (nom. illeg.) TaxID=47850 RepID=UPI0034311706
MSTALQVIALVLSAVAGLATGFWLSTRRLLRERQAMRIQMEHLVKIQDEAHDLYREAVATRASVTHLTHAIAGSQAWFWSPEWQEGEREATEDIAAGHSIIVGSVDEMDTELDIAAKQYADFKV